MLNATEHRSDARPNYPLLGALWAAVMFWIVVVIALSWMV
jgi:hypothetical protein